MMARQIVEDGWLRLEAAGVAEARVKMEWWVCEVLGVQREQLDTTAVDDPAAKRIEDGTLRLLQHEPLQYVIGHAPFLHLDLRTDSRALIPRPETEELVMRVLSCAALWSRGDVAIADVGAGTGCIALALASRRPAASIVATDLSPDALDLARENAARNGLTGRVEFRHNHLLDGFAPESLDAVVSNPPYIARVEIETLEVCVRKFEPLMALNGGEDGLDVLRKLIVQAFTALKKDGRLWLEIGDDQGSSVRELLAQAGFQHVVIEKDMYGQTRFAEAMK